MIFPGKDDVVLTESNVGFKGYWGDSYEVADEDISGEAFGGGIRAKYITFDINFFSWDLRVPKKKTPGGKKSYPAFDANAVKKALSHFQIQDPRPNLC